MLNLSGPHGTGPLRDALLARGPPRGERLGGRHRTLMGREPRLQYRTEGAHEGRLERGRLRLPHLHRLRGRHCEGSCLGM